jgi:hypothetical protein
MIERERFVATRAARIVLGITVAIGLVATVAASPIASRARLAAALTPSTQIPATTPTAFRPLGDGPAVSVERSFGRHDEDCVTVTQVKGADGRVYATRGMVCAE